MSNYFIAFWCVEGFEYVADITEWAPEVFKMEQAQAILSGETPPDDSKFKQDIFGMKMRAKFNTDRYYELYAFEAGNSLELDDIKEWTDQSPQDAANWIRENGVAIVKRAGKPRSVIS